MPPLKDTTLEMHRGKAETWAFAVTDENGDAEPIGASDTFRFTAKESFADLDDDAVFQLTRGSGILVDGDGTAGTGTITTSPANTTGLDNSRQALRFDLQWTPSGGNPKTVARGTLVVLPSVTLAST